MRSPTGERGSQPQIERSPVAVSEITDPTLVNFPPCYQNANEARLFGFLEGVMDTGEQALWKAILDHLEITEKLLEHYIERHPVLLNLKTSAAKLRERIDTTLRQKAA